MALFKALQFKDDRTKILGYYASPIFESDWGGTNTPQLMLPETTIEKLKLLYPKHDFKNVKLIILRVTPLAETNSA